ncbi:MAG: nucleotidyltransferase family protein, partial [Ginsengibacter sp.]
MISAIVLAAGLSTRMGSENKLLLPFNGKPVIVTVIENIIHSGIEERIVVTGRDAGLVSDLLKSLPVKIIYNDAFKKGMTATIQKGVSVANGEGYMICLGDMPFITSGEYKQLSVFFKKQRQENVACICIAEH